MGAPIVVLLGFASVGSLLTPEYPHSIVFISSYVCHVPVDGVPLSLVQLCDAFTARELVAELDVRLLLDHLPGYALRAL